MDDSFHYFAYGSNMLTKRLSARTPSVIADGIGYLEGYRLGFDKVSNDGSGKCDIKKSGVGGDRVHGVLFRIASADLAELDRAEGEGVGYARKQVEVCRKDRQAVGAYTYMATRNRPGLLPYSWYKALVIAGALEHGLPPKYIEWLQTVDSKPDPDPQRASNATQLLREVE